MLFFNKKESKKSNTINDMLAINEINYHDLGYLKQRIYFEKSRAERNQHKFSLILLNWTGIRNVVRKQKRDIELSQILQKIITQICISLRETDIVAIDESDQRIIILLPDTPNEEAEQVFSRMESHLASHNDLKNYASKLMYDSNVIIFTCPFETNGTDKINGYSKIEEHINIIDIGSPISNLMNRQANGKFKLNSRFSPPLSFNINGNSLVMNRMKFFNIDIIDELSRKLQLTIKRIFDIIGAFSGLIITSPILFIIALLIKTTSRGPILFKQVRIGYRGKKFEIFKFRSMQKTSSEETHKDYIIKLLTEDTNNSNGDNIAEYKDQIDNRITRIGNFIRKTSIDELPQLLNVLKGDMSLVGPRPHPTYEVELYRNWYYRRLLVKPGLAGLSKLHLRCTPENYQEAMRFDVRYVEDWSVIKDLKIMLKTIPLIFSKNGAY